MKEKAYYFDHERLDVYQAAIAFVILASDILESFPRGKAYLVDQLQRASSSLSKMVQVNGNGSEQPRANANVHGAHQMTL